MEYNTARNQIVVPEYGRNVQKIVEYAVSLENREERNELAKFIVRMMTNINMSGGHNCDNEQMVWDHLFMISDFKLDIDAPYPMPDKAKLQSKPQRLSYADNELKFRTYGRNLEKIVEVAVNMEEGEEKEELVKLIAYNLKKDYLNWNQKFVDDEQIVKDLERMSKGRLSLPEDYDLPSSNDVMGKRRQQNKNTQKPSNQKYKSKGQKKKTHK